MDEIILRMSGISKNYYGNQVLSGVDFEVKKGTIHAIVGENGAGKSTLMKILTGVVKPSSGTIEYKGEQIEITHPKEIFSLGIGVVYQEFNLMPDLSVAQNVFISREPQRKVKGFLDEKKMNQMAATILAELDCKISPTAKVSSLSVAEQQMVEIAKSLSYNCDLLIMDEPTAALTDHEILTLFKTIKQLKSKGVAIIYISHRMSDLDAIVDIVSVLRDGKMIATHEYHPEIKPQLICEMVGRDLTQQFPPKPEYTRGDLTLEVQNLNSGKKLKNISFKAYKGEILGIVGLMGAGRTELMKAIFGAYKKDNGQVLLFGEPQEIRDPYQAIRKGLGYISEDRKKDGLMLGLSIKDNIAISSLRKFTAKGFVSDSLEERESEKFMQKMSIKANSVNQLVQTLSGGNQQKVMVAKWLCANTRILILDEPTRGIDVKSKFEIYELMYEMVQSGVTIIMISSDMPEVLGMSDRILVMSEGRITGEVMKADATQELLLQYAMIED